MQRHTRLGFAIVALALVAFAANGSSLVHSQTEAAIPAGEHLQVVSTLLPSGIQQVLLVDTDAKSLAIYHVEPVNGKVQLKSVRRFVWDLQMEQFNGQAPLPSELREMQPGS